MNKRPNVISVRPRKGSELEAVWLECQRDIAVMREKIHAWANDARKEKQQ